MIKAAWLQRFRLADPPTFDRIVQSWDTANKPSELSDYFVCTTWGVKGPRFYLLNVLRKKLSYPELRRVVVEQDRLFSPQSIVIEDRASGTQLIQDLIGDGLSHVARFSPTRSCGLHAQSAVIENGFVFAPEEAPWKGAGDEGTRPSSSYGPASGPLIRRSAPPSPNGRTARHDDQVDWTAQALAWAKKKDRPQPAGPEFWAENLAWRIGGRGGFRSWPPARNASGRRRESAPPSPDREKGLG
jgi:predicted phage terminase large subunit-like protein